MILDYELNKLNYGIWKGNPLCDTKKKNNLCFYIDSKTKNIEELTRQADIVVAAVGRPLMVKKDWIKEGAIVIDVGINRVNHPENPGKTKLVGDVDFDEVLSVASAITPVPGGVGPMTIACLLKNTVDAAIRQQQ